WLGIFPGLPVGQHGVEGDQHFANQGGGGDLGGFAGGDEAAVKMAEWRGAAGGGAGRQVEGGAHRSATAGARAGALVPAAVMVKRGEADQGGNGAPCQPAELGQQRDQGGGGRVLDTAEGGHQPAFGEEL